MVQEFHVTRCVTCENFQVHQVKKSTTRWSCKVCGEKQSLLKEYGRGSAADCRRHVQKLNAMRGAMLEEQERSVSSLWEQEQGQDGDAEQKSTETQTHQSQIQTSRWSKYLDTPKEVEPEQEPEDDEVLIDRQNCPDNNRMNNRKRKREAPSEQACQSVRQITSTGTREFNQSRTRTIDGTHSLFQSSKTALYRSTTRTTEVNNSWVQPSKTSLNQSRTSYTGLNHCNPPSVKQSRSETTGLSQHKPSEWNQSSPPSSRSEATPTGLSSGCGSRWTRFLTSDPPTNEQSPLKSERGVINTKSHPCLHASSIFETGEDFSIDEF